jgi:hypothetical protein
MWRATVLTIFPDMFPGPLGVSLAGKALAAKRWSLEAVDIRAHASDKHRSVDDTPAGGGPGMVMRADVLARAVDAALAAGDARARLLMSPRGAPLTQARVASRRAGAVILCGRFEGIDERLIEAASSKRFRSAITSRVGDRPPWSCSCMRSARRHGQGGLGREQPRPARISAGRPFGRHPPPPPSPPAATTPRSRLGGAVKPSGSRASAGRTSGRRIWPGAANAKSPPRGGARSRVGTGDKSAAVS